MMTGCISWHRLMMQGLLGHFQVGDVSSAWAYSLTLLLSYSLTLLLSLSLTHSLTLSLTHSLTLSHSLALSYSLLLSLYSLSRHG